jgi:hypothetical protein
MVQMAVADGTIMTPLTLYQVGERPAMGAPSMDASAVSARPAGDRPLLASQVQRMGPAESTWEHLAEGCAWVLDACD